MSELCREGDSTLACRNVPIVFVPGVMGSRLHFTNVDEYWDPDSNWRMLHWVRIGAERARQEMHFAEPGEVMTEGPDLEANERDRGWEGVAWGFYGDFLRWLNRENFSPNTCPVYAAGYDWRQPNRVSARRLAARIDAIMERERAEHVIIVTHSMGGIVTRAALKQTTGLGDKVKGVIHVVQPVTGAVKFYRMCYTGAVRQWDGGFGLSMILGTTPVDFQTIVSALPGPVQLMPTNQYRYWARPWLYHRSGGVDTAYPNNAYTNYRDTALPPGAVDTRCSAIVQRELRQRIVDADAFHEWLALYKLPDKTWAVYSTGLASDHQSVFNIDPPVGDFRGYLAVRPPDGDGTVPGPSAAALFPDELNKHYPNVNLDRTNRQFEVLNVEHGDAFKDLNVRQIVRRFIYVVR